jgi:NTE family protein
MGDGWMSDRRIGLVLGGGGARGLAHILVIEALDELGLRPAAIAGTSIGAIFGAGAAAGVTGKAMREVAIANFASRARLIAKLWSLRPQRLVDLWQSGGSVQIDPERVLNLFVGDLIPPSFDDLIVPLTVTATDFYGWGPHDLSAGNLRKAVAASMAIPMLFRPVQHEDCVLLDGGVVNPLPLDRLPAPVDIVVACDVIAFPEPHDTGRLPTPREAMLGATQLLMQAVVTEKLRTHPPDLLLRPHINSFRLFDFHRVEEILKVNEPLKDEVKRRLHRVLSAQTTEVIQIAAPEKRLPRRRLPRLMLPGRTRRPKPLKSE